MSARTRLGNAIRDILTSFGPAGLPNFDELPKDLQEVYVELVDEAQASFGRQLFTSDGRFAERIVPPTSAVLQEAAGEDLAVQGDLLRLYRQERRASTPTPSNAAPSSPSAGPSGIKRDEDDLGAEASGGLANS